MCTTRICICLSVDLKGITTLVYVHAKNGYIIHFAEKQNAGYLLNEAELG